MELNLVKMERRYVMEALIRSNNKHDKASKLLGISIRTLSRKKAQHGIKSDLIYELIKNRKNATL